MFKKSIFSIALCAACLNVSCAHSETLRSKVAKMLIVGVDGTSLSQYNPVIQDVIDDGVAGVILFERNIEPVESGVDSKKQLQKFVSDLKALRQDPLIVAIDQEGGLVNRMKSKYGFADMVSHKEVGQKGSDEFARQTAQTIASEVASVGINLNFAPCVDVDVNPECPVIGRVKRSFSSDEDAVSRYAAIYINEHHKHNVKTSLKHFPGHGSSLKDSHLGFTDITNTWQERELEPYRQLIASSKCDAVMVSHLYNSKFDSEYPATLSRPIIDSLLRGVLGWDGVVITDDMQMRAIRDHYGFEQAIILAVNAGVDIFVIGGNLVNEKFDLSQRFINCVVDAVESGKIEEERVDSAVRRVDEFMKNMK